jgi:apolipoprotein N-acyltransferase
VRAANTGITGIVDPYGRVRVRTGLFEQTVIVDDARYVHSRTLYTRLGDLAAYLSVLITAALLAVVRRSYRMS